jgi:type IV pilus assembly protein PilA
VAIILGHLSLSEIKKSGGRLGGRGLAIAGLVLGYAGIAFIPMILIIAAITIPNLLHARIAANEASAVSSLRILGTAELSYAASHPEAGFTCSLTDLSRDNLISGDLASGRKTGYTFELANCSAEPPGAMNTKFRVVAYPQRSNQSGRRAFCSDESQVIKVDEGGSAQRCLEDGIPFSQ